MKRIVVVATLALLGAYLYGRTQLGASGAMDYLVRMENLTNEGKADEICEMFHDDLEVSISDRTGQAPKEIDGGKKELCELTHDTVAALRAVPHSMNVEWNDVEVTRHWLHPWTSEISYTEDRAFSIRGANITIRTTSDDTIMLVQTLAGVKLRKLKAESWISE